MVDEEKSKGRRVMEIIRYRTTILAGGYPRKRGGIVFDEKSLIGILAAAGVWILPPGNANEALREVILILVDWEMGNGANAGDAASRQMAQLISERIKVPRNMWVIPTLALGNWYNQYSDINLFPMAVVRW